MATTAASADARRHLRVPDMPACYSTVPVFTIDETAKTATFVFHPTTPDYSFFGGNAEVLKNGNVEYARMRVHGPSGEQRRDL